MKSKIQVFDTAIGRLGLVAADDGKRLREIRLPNDLGDDPSAHFSVQPGQAATAEALQAWASGELQELPLAWLDMDDFTDFRRRVSLAAYAIPRGETRCYGELAVAVNSPRAARAVGRVMATNPFPLVIPCHRVLGTTGLHGFGGGLALKARLLALESA